MIKRAWSCRANWCARTFSRGVAGAPLHDFRIGEDARGNDRLYHGNLRTIYHLASTCKDGARRAVAVVDPELKGLRHCRPARSPNASIMQK